MKRNIFLLVLSVCIGLLVVFFACRSQKPVPESGQKKSEKSGLTHVEKTENVNKSVNLLRIATFNIQNLGKSKLSKPLIMDTLVAIVRNFDIVAIQEISDISNQTAGRFLEMINKKGATQYEMVCSNRSGCQANDKTSAEQYAFYYNPALVQLVDNALYNDSEADYFQREPYIAQFKYKKNGQMLTICTIHTAPEQAVEEIGALSKVVNWMPSRFKNTENIIICGDFNASCSYASTTELDDLAIRKSPFYWVIPDDEKTNLSKNTCAYDRFVTTTKLKDKIKKWEVYRYFKSKAVSDHWPGYIELAM